VNEGNQANSYIIEPWDHLMETQTSDGSVHDQYVPPELEDLARQVMGHYDMSVSSMLLITAKPDKGGAIWRIDTNKGPRSIKVLHRTPNRSLFSIGAQDYLVQQGARVPALIPTVEGELYVNAGGKSWIVTDWIEPLTPVSKIDMTGVQDLCRGLGEFHRITRGYTPPFGSVKASRLYRWPQHYEKIMMKLSWFEDIANIYSEFPAASTLLSMLPQIKAEAADYYMMFRDSAYERMIAMGEPHWGLAHQDYGWSNGQMGPDGIWIIDLDGVAYDIPIRDLRKLITSTMVDNGGWDINWVRGMIEAYNEGNPIDRETFELLWIDMAFPNEFYKHVKEVVYEPELFMPTELEPILQLIQNVEMKKWDVLNELKLDMERYPAGDYPVAEEAAPLIMPISLPGAAANVGDVPLLPVEALPATAASADSMVAVGEAVAAGAVAATVEQWAAHHEAAEAEAVAAVPALGQSAAPPAQPFFTEQEAAVAGTGRRWRRLRRLRAGSRPYRAAGMSKRRGRRKSSSSRVRTATGQSRAGRSRVGQGNRQGSTRWTRNGASGLSGSLSGRRARASRARRNIAAGSAIRLRRTTQTPAPVYRAVTATRKSRTARRRRSTGRGKRSGSSSGGGAQGFVRSQKTSDKRMIPVR